MKIVQCNWTILNIQSVLVLGVPDFGLGSLFRVGGKILCFSAQNVFSLRGNTGISTV